VQLSFNKERDPKDSVHSKFIISTKQAKSPKFTCQENQVGFEW
jgi:hypothetical protein